MALASKVRTRVKVKARDRDKARGRDKIKTSSKVMDRGKDKGKRMVDREVEEETILVVRLVRTNRSLFQARLVRVPARKAMMATMPLCKRVIPYHTLRSSNSTIRWPTTPLTTAVYHPILKISFMAISMH